MTAVGEKSASQGRAPGIRSGAPHGQQHAVADKPAPYPTEEFDLGTKGGWRRHHAIPACAALRIGSGALSNLGDQTLAHAFQVIDTARALDQAIQDAERGERGFIITGKTEYLEPYSTGIKEAPDKLAQLKKLTEENPEQQRRIQFLDEQINAKLSELR